MNDYDVVEASDDGNYRVRLVADDYIEQPYDETGPLVLRIMSGWSPSSTAEVLAGDHGNGEAEAVSRALEHFGSPSDREFRKFEKWARAFLGTRYIDTWYSDGYRGWYVALDSAAWRAMVGQADDYVRPDGSSYLSEWEAWATGDVYGYVVERRVVQETVTRDLDGKEISRDTHPAWEEVDSCWGFYGYD